MQFLSAGEMRSTRRGDVTDWSAVAIESKSIPFISNHGWCLIFCREEEVDPSRRGIRTSKMADKKDKHSLERREPVEQVEGKATRGGSITYEGSKNFVISAVDRLVIWDNEVV